MWRIINQISGNNTRPTARMLCILAVVVLLLAGCEYHTIGDNSVQLPTPTTKAAAAAPRASSGIKALPTSTPKDAQEQVYCRLADLTPTATWNVSGNILVGTLTLTNYWETPCTLRGQPELGIVDERGVPYPLKVTAPESGLEPPTWLFVQNTVAEIRFSWSNWCGFTPQGSLRVTAALPDQSGPALYVVVEDPNGKPLENTPPCQDSDNKQTKPSTLLVEELRVLN
jgi:hypothetical protein